MDSLLSIVQMPGGVPVATFAIGESRRQERGAACRRHPGAVGRRRWPSGWQPGARKQTAHGRRNAVRQMSDAKRFPAPVPPGGTIGILGGGQLGRMLALAAARLGLKTHIYSPTNDDAPAFQVTPRTRVRRSTIEAALAEFRRRPAMWSRSSSRTCPAATVETIARSVPVNPERRGAARHAGPLRRKDLRRSLGLADRAVSQRRLPRTMRRTRSRGSAAPAILKTRRFGYDGKGQAKVRSAEDAATRFRSFKGAPSILEGFVDFAFEASVVAARGDGRLFAAYDPPENDHENHILRRSTVPSRSDARAQCRRGQGASRSKIAEALDYVGVLAVELFVGKDGALLVNEIAPRVHNSGHWTIDACARQPVRAAYPRRRRLAARAIPRATPMR